MDKIWGNPSKSEVIGRCGGDEKTELPRRTDKSRTLKNPKISPYVQLIAGVNRRVQLHSNDQIGPEICG